MNTSYLDSPQKLNTAEHPGCIFQHLNIYFEEGRRGGYRADLVLQQWRDGELQHVRFSSAQSPRIVEAILCSLGDLNQAAFTKCIKGLQFSTTARRLREQAKSP